MAPPACSLEVGTRGQQWVRAGGQEFFWVGWGQERQPAVGGNMYSGSGMGVAVGEGRGGSQQWWGQVE